MADQPNEKPEAVASAADAQGAPAAENKTAEPALADEKAKTEEASKDDGKVAEGRSIPIT